MCDHFEAHAPCRCTCGVLPQNIYIQTQKRTISEGETLIFNENADGNAYAGGGFVFSINDGEIYDIFGRIVKNTQKNTLYIKNSAKFMIF